MLWFEVIYGMRINFTKKEMVPVGMVTEAEVLANTLGFLRSLLFK